MPISRSFPALAAPLLLAPLLMLPSLPAAAGPQSHACAAVVEPDARLACYDAAFPPTAEVRTRADEVEEQRAKSLADFGLDARQREARDPAAAAAVPGRIQALVADVDYQPTGERVVTLDNGQVWLLTEVSSRGRLESGHPVVVRKAALGSFMLVTEGGVALRARRVR